MKNKDFMKLQPWATYDMDNSLTILQLSQDKDNNSHLLHPIRRMKINFPRKNMLIAKKYNNQTSTRTAPQNHFKTSRNYFQRLKVNINMSQKQDESHQQQNRQNKKVNSLRLLSKNFPSTQKKKDKKQVKNCFLFRSINCGFQSIETKKRQVPRECEKNQKESITQVRKKYKSENVQKNPKLITYNINQHFGHKRENKKTIEQKKFHTDKLRQNTSKKLDDSYVFEDMNIFTGDKNEVVAKTHYVLRKKQENIKKRTTEFNNKWMASQNYTSTKKQQKNIEKLKIYKFLQ